MGVAVANKFVSYVRRFKHCIYVLSILTSWLPVTEDLELLNSIMNKIFALHVFDLTPVHYTAILGVPILPVPTLIGF